MVRKYCAQPIELSLISKQVKNRGLKIHSTLKNRGLEIHSTLNNSSTEDFIPNKLNVKTRVTEN